MLVPGHKNNILSVMQHIIIATVLTYRVIFCHKTVISILYKAAQ